MKSVMNYMESIDGVTKVSQIFQAILRGKDPILSQQYSVQVHLNG